MTAYFSDLYWRQYTATATTDKKKEKWAPTITVIVVPLPLPPPDTICVYWKLKMTTTRRRKKKRKRRRRKKKKRNPDWYIGTHNEGEKGDLLFIVMPYRTQLGTVPMPYPWRGNSYRKRAVKEVTNSYCKETPWNNKYKKEKGVLSCRTKLGTVFMPYP